MKALKRWILPVLSLVLVGFFSSTVFARGAYTMMGKISAINEAQQVVVVQVPVRKAQLMTVAGELVPGAKLTKNGRKAELGDFHVGERVVVSWQKTDKTLLIRGLRTLRWKTKK